MQTGNCFNAKEEGTKTEQEIRYYRKTEQEQENRKNTGNRDRKIILLIGIAIRRIFMWGLGPLL